MKRTKLKRLNKSFFILDSRPNWEPKKARASEPEGAACLEQLEKKKKNRSRNSSKNMRLLYRLLEDGHLKKKQEPEQLGNSQEPEPLKKYTEP